ncbi:MAG: ATP-binding protein [Clostridia bacterium]|nr:ATP-binding protein [Clostridia bacterium]
MAKVILVCGKICSGKTTYARQRIEITPAVILSVDEIMLAVFGQHAGDRHDEYSRRIQQYLFEKSAELTGTGTDVILDWGFWTRQSRADARAYYRQRQIACEFHYLDISPETWDFRLRKRNAAVLAGEVSAYYVDDALAAKFAARFEMPERDEIDVWVRI